VKRTSIGIGANEPFSGWIGRPRPTSLPHDPQPRHRQPASAEPAPGPTGYALAKPAPAASRQVGRPEGGRQPEVLPQPLLPLAPGDRVRLTLSAGRCGRH
jgi:hypothetical protein